MYLHLSEYLMGNHCNLLQNCTNINLWSCTRKISSLKITIFVQCCMTEFDLFLKSGWNRHTCKLLITFNGYQVITMIKFKVMPKKIHVWLSTYFSNNLKLTYHPRLPSHVPLARLTIKKREKKMFIVSSSRFCISDKVTRWTPPG